MAEAAESLHACLSNELLREDADRIIRYSVKSAGGAHAVCRAAPPVAGEAWWDPSGCCCGAAPGASARLRDRRCAVRDSCTSCSRSSSSNNALCNLSRMSANVARSQIGCVAGSKSGTEAGVARVGTGSAAAASTMPDHLACRRQPWRDTPAAPRPAVFGRPAWAAGADGGGLGLFAMARRRTRPTGRPELRLPSPI